MNNYEQENLWFIKGGPCVTLRLLIMLAIQTQLLNQQNRNYKINTRLMV